MNASVIIEKDVYLTEKLLSSAQQTILFLASNLQADGSYVNAKDISCYYKSPMLFIAAQKKSQAKLILNYIKTNFMTSDGDFLSEPNLKSVQAAYQDFWTYINGWIVRAANLIDEADITQLGLKYLTLFKLGADKGFMTNHLSSQNKISDILTTSHHGLLNLELDNDADAISAGNYLCSMFEQQPELNAGFYTRSDINTRPITEFSINERPFYFVSRTEPEQLYFLLGYPAAYLALLYQKTKIDKFLQNAKAYLDFALSCHENIYRSNFSHKLAWAASCIYKITEDNVYFHVIERISNYFISNQKNGMWYLENSINAAYDQSAEIAYWFLEITRNINLKGKML